VAVASGSENDGPSTVLCAVQLFGKHRVPGDEWRAFTYCYGGFLTVFASQDVDLTLNVNPDNVIDVPGSSKTNALMTFALPSFVVKFTKRISEYEQAVSNVHFSVAAESTGMMRDGESSFRAPGQGSEACRLLLSLPKHHPKSLLLPAVSIIASGSACR
jgi:hypothetical protein